jgi:hypothetical protein
MVAKKSLSLAMVNGHVRIEAGIGKDREDVKGWA